MGASRPGESRVSGVSAGRGKLADKLALPLLARHLISSSSVVVVLFSGCQRTALDFVPEGSSSAFFSVGRPP